MSVAENAVAPPRTATMAATTPGEISARHRLLVYLGCTVVALVTNYLLGKDLAWDTLNYHLYAGFSALNDRFSQDYFAAGPPSYFNPYAFVPFYAMVRAGLSPLLISSALALAHSAILWLTFELAVCVCPQNDRRMRMKYGLCAVVIAFCNPIIVQQIGSSYADITTAEFALAGWLLLVHVVRVPSPGKVVSAGLLLGFSVALKPTNAIHAIAGGSILIMLPRPLYDKIRYALGCAAAVGLGFAVIAAPWSSQLERMFGNPFFPLMNGIFRSPEFTTEPLRHFRFIPDSLTMALWRPFAIVDPVPMVQEELTAPDLRYALLFMLGCILAIRWIWLRLAHPESPLLRRGSGSAARLAWALGCALTVDWILWLTGSGNGRYFLPAACLAAIIIVALIFQLCGSRLKLRNYILCAVIGAQIIQLCFGANYRWNSVAWDRKWLDIDVPAQLAGQSNLYLTIGIQSNSFIAPYLSAGSGLINISGGYALGPEGAGGQRIHALIRRYSPHLQVLWSGDLPSLGGSNSERARLPAEDALARFGLSLVRNACVTIVVHGLPREAGITFINSVPGDVAAPIDHHPNDTSHLVSCRVVPDVGDRSELIAREHAVDLVFNHLEDACPALFQPRRLRTEHYLKVWRRLYVNTDLVALIYHGSLKFFNPVRGGSMVNLGPESEWSKAPLTMQCGREGGHWFARVLGSRLEAMPREVL